jgi:hypothetical protein
MIERKQKHVERRVGEPAAQRSAPPAGDVAALLQLQRSAGNQATMRLAGALAARRAAPSGGTQAPPSGGADEQRRIIVEFSADFSDVRVTEAPRAAPMGALAYTRGTDLHFSPGRYDPSTEQGQELLGHELAHVIQQRVGRVRR